MSIVSYAQNFEDVMHWRALGHIKHGLYIDIGAQDPVVDSVSMTFHQRGWNGVHVEPVQHDAELLPQQRSGDVVLQAAVGNKERNIPFFKVVNTGLSTLSASVAEQHSTRFEVNEISVACITLKTIFNTCNSGAIHWLKIDVEGSENQVLESWGTSLARPWVVVIESTLPSKEIQNHEI